MAWTRSHWTDAGLLAETIDPDEDPPESAKGKAPEAWYGELVAAGEMPDAVFFLAHALPRYDCVVWVTRALIDAGVLDRTRPETVALLRWIDEPSDSLRRAVNDAAATLRSGSPVKMLAQAVFLSGGSIAPPDLPAVQPPPQACPRMAGAALLVGLLSQADGETAVRKALRLGESIAAEQH